MANKNSWSMDTIYEMIGDLACFNFILKIKSLINDVETKGYLSQFLKIVAPVYVCEIANSLEYFGIVKKSDFYNPGMKKKVEMARTYAVKRPIVKSSQCERVAKEMGLNFDNKVYDMNIILQNNKLIGMNYEDYMDYVDREDVAFWESLFDFPKRTLKTLCASLQLDIDLDDILNENTDTLKRVATIAEKELCCKRYSYSVCTLFSKSTSLDMRDKIFILYRYRLLSSVEKIEVALPPFEIKFGNDCVVGLKKFFRKYKALVIEMIWNELQELNTEFSIAVKREVDAKIKVKEFFPLNRALRDNLHYKETTILVQAELELIDQYQPIYLEIIRTLMLENLTIDVGKECIRVTNFFKACQKKGLDKGEILKYQHYYYLKYLIFGKV